ncbi:MAG: type II secretion system F family protein [Ilumatobacteraceae bacterium]
MSVGVPGRATLAGASTAGTVVLAATAHRPRSRTPPAPSSSPALPARRRRGPSRRVVTGVSVAILAPLAALVAGVVPVGLAGALVTVAVVRRQRGTVRRIRRSAEEAMPDAIELLVLCIHAGRSPRQAVEQLAARAPPCLRPAFAAVELQVHRGRSLAEALGELPRVLGPPGRELATAIAGADRDGLPLAPVLDRLATEARAIRRRLGEAEARRLPVRLTFPLVACTLPSFVILAIAPAVLGALSTLRATAP